MIARVRRLAGRLRHPGVPPVLAAAAAGALGFALLGTTPASQRADTGATREFALPTLPAAAPDAQALLAGTPLWASQPAIASAAVVEPPPRLVGIIGTSGRRVGVFEWRDGRRQRVGVGDTLAGQGVVRVVEATRVLWRADDGADFEARLFLNPEPQALPPRTPPSSP